MRKSFSKISILLQSLSRMESASIYSPNNPAAITPGSLWLKAAAVVLFLSIQGVIACVPPPRKAAIPDPVILKKSKLKELSKEGIFLAQKGHFDKAGEKLEKVLRDDPEKADVKIILADIYLKLNRNDEAISLLEEIRSLNDNNPEFFQLIGRAYFNKADMGRAVKAYQQALKINANHAATHNAMGEYFKAQGEIKKADNSYRKALKIDPNLGLAHYNIGLLFEERKQYLKAVSEFQAAIMFGEKSNNAYHHLGMLLNQFYNQGKNLKIADWEIASEAFEYLLSKNPSDAGIHNLLGIAYLKTSFPQKAADRFKRAILLNSGKPDYHYSLGTAYEALEIPDKALEEYKRAVELDEKNVNARSRMAAIFFKQEKYDRSEKINSEILQIEPGNFAAKTWSAKLKKIRQPE